MSAKLFEPITIRGVEFKNRIAMSPMCMHSAGTDGCINDFHVVHYGARALGGAGLVFLESTAILQSGLVGHGDLGIWNDDQVPGLAHMVDVIHKMGSKAGAQIGHAGRKVGVDSQRALAPSAVPFDDASRTPEPLDEDGIAEMVEAFGQAARRTREAGFDVLEVHTAHGYLLGQFLSPIANKRTDRWGGSHENRYRIVRAVLDRVKQEWTGPLFVRISSTDYVEGGNRPEDFLIFGKWMQEQGVDLIDCSSGGLAMIKVDTYPNYQVPAAELLKKELGIMTGAVGMIETGRQAEEILRNGRADIVLVGREMLKDPFWARTAADDLRTPMGEVPDQYTRYGSAWQRSQPLKPAAPAISTEGVY